MSGGFLKEEGLDPEWSISPPGVSAIAALQDGSAHVVQSALSQGFTSLGKGEVPAAVHFAQINEMDGFFLTAREADPDFGWDKLEGADVVLFGGGQPLAMFKYACHKAGIDFDRINAINVGGAGDMDEAFRAGEGQYVQQQGPFPQQLEAATGSGTSWPRSASRSALAASPAWRRLATGSARTWRKPSCAPTGRPGST